MKLTTLLITITILHVSAATYGQRITLSEKNASLLTVFDDIKSQTGYDFMVSATILRSANTVTINVKNVALEDLLKQLFQDQPLTYEVGDKSILIKQKEPSFLSSLKDKTAKLFSLPADINGRVTDSLDRPLIGASVRLKDTRYSVLTDNKGNFTFPSVPQGKYMLTINYMGYNKLEKNLELEGKTINLNIILHISSSALDQVQVIGYGTDSKRFRVGSVYTVNADAIEKQPVTNPLLALQGQVPGLSVIAQTGVPGSTALVQIRGQNSLATNLSLKPYDQPYFVVDGVPFAAQNTNLSQFNNLATSAYVSGGLSQETGISAFNNINPNDIESITILKDADATAIYGTKGANGVVLITTKKGKAGKTSFDLSINSQVNEVARPIQLLNTQQYLQVRKLAFAQDGLTPSSNPNSNSYAPDLTIYDQNKYTNWQKVIQGNLTKNTDVHASVSGGGANNTFLISGGYTRSNYNYPGDFADQRYTLHSAITNSSADKKFSLTLITDYAYDQNNSASFGGSVILPPNAPDQTDGKGNLIWDYKGVPNYANFYAGLKAPTTLATFNFNSSLNLSYEVFKGLTIGSNIGYSRTTGTEHNIMPLAAQYPSPEQISSAAFGNTSSQAINVEPQINYSKTIGRGTLTALVGGTYEKNTSDAFQTQAFQYSNDNFLNSVNEANSTAVHDVQGIAKYVAFFGRLKYIYDQKYILEVSGRRDGSSNFGPGKQFGNFGSAGAGWIFSEEKLFKDALPFVSYGKLSGSYGTTGSDASQAYRFQALYGTFPDGNTTPFQGIKQNIPINLYNPDFQWATKKSINVAVDLGFLNNRLMLNATYYRDRQGDQLVSYPLAAQTGFATVFENQNANVQNKGLEFTLTSTNIKTKDFTWTSSFNISFNRNKLISFPNLESSPYASQYVIGQPTSVVFGYRYKDVNPATGLFEYYAADGTVTSKPKSALASQGGDKVIIGNMETRYMGGFGNTFIYKNFSLYIFCQFSSSEQPNAQYGLYNNDLPGYQVNLPAYVLGKYWTAPGQNATLQRLSTGYGSPSTSSAYAFPASDAAYADDTYLRVKTVAVSYALPDTWLKKVKVRNASVFINAQNVFTITNYKFGDPEQPGSYTVFPLQRIIAFGLNLKF